MSAIGEWGRRLWYLLNRRRFGEALRREMEAHRAEMHEPRRFGNTLRLREESRDAWGWTWIDDLARDVRLAARALLRTRGFTGTSVASLALGFALTASMVAVVNAYLIRSLPYPATDRLYHVRYAPPGPWEPGGMSALDWASVSDVVRYPITAIGSTVYLTDGGHAQPARTLRVGRGFIPGLGVRVVAGRLFAEEEFGPGAERVGLVGHALWRDRYGGDPSIVGRVVRADAEDGGIESFRIIGVLAPEFYFGRDSRDRPDFLLPLTSPARTYMLRLGPGVSPSAAEQRLTEAARAVATELPPDWTGVQLDSAVERYVGDIRPVLVGVAVATALVLLIVCANVAVLTLLRGLRREKELAVRVALGSGRMHIARMLFLESSLICVAALALGVALTTASLRSIAPLVEQQLGRPAPRGTDAIALDGTVLFVLGAAALAIALALAFLPLMTPWQRRLAETLRRTGAAVTDGHAARRSRSGLIVLEIAGTAMLLVACASTIRGAIAMVRTELGFHPEGLMRARVVLRARDYPDGDFSRFHTRFVERAGAELGAPIVYSTWPPFAEFPTQLVETDDGGAGRMRAGAIAVGPSYFTTLGIDLRAGRDIGPGDQGGSEPVAVVSETLARRLWPGGQALGRRVRTIEETAGGLRPPGPWRTVVAIVADVRQSYADAQRADIYVPIEAAAAGRFGSFYVRSPQPMAALTATLRRMAAELDAYAVVDLPRRVVDENSELAGTRFLTGMLSAFAGVAVFLAVLGIYGVTAYAVQQRERELAIRVALGATGRALTRLFLREGGIVIAVGLAAGVAGAVVAGRALENRLELARGPEVWSLLATIVVIAIAGAVAIWRPSRRASVQSPAAVLKDA